MQKSAEWLIGVDEAGRGPLAGPVAVGVVAIPAIFDWSLIKEVRESKQLTVTEREFWFGIIRRAERAGMLFSAVAMSSAARIDRVGIVGAINHAMALALQTIQIDPQKSYVLLDGALRAPSKYVYQKTIIKGDEKEPIIALASIAAKVQRDARLVGLAKKYPAYGFERHKGYGTSFHLAQIQKNGLSPEHRQTFCRNLGKTCIL